MRSNKRLTVGYVRSETKDGESVKQQEKQIKEFCLKKGYKLSKIYTDNGYSGANTNRPAFNKLQEEVFFGLVKRVVCTDSSRILRNVGRFLSITLLFKENGAEIVSPNSKVDVCLSSFLKMTKGLRNSVDTFVSELKFASDSENTKG